MDRHAHCFLVLLGFSLCLGCGQESKVAETPPVEVEEAAFSTETSISSPTNVVSQFLDEVRRGGVDSCAHDLLTDRAQSELRRIGRTVQPIGSPDAGFSVTRAESVPGEPNSSLVHSVWSEPNPSGSKTEIQVVWAVERESAGWRISGLAMELAPQEVPVIIDFENGDLMAKLLAESGFGQSSENEKNLQATATGNTISR